MLLDFSAAPTYGECSAGQLHPTKVLFPRQIPHQGASRWRTRWICHLGKRDVMVSKTVRQIFRILVSIVSTTSSIPPARTSFPMAIAKPTTWSASIWDGRESAFGSVTTSMSAGPEC